MCVTEKRFSWISDDASAKADDACKCKLKDFARITLNPGQTKTVEFVITREKLEAYDLDMKRVVQPGDFEIMVGGSSIDLLKDDLKIKK